MTALQPDASEIRSFLDAVFRYADPGTFVSLRAFDQVDRGRPPVLIEGVKVNGDFSPMVARAAAAATKAANSPRPAVFAPPVATFRGARTAKTADVANGVALSVEMDEGNPREALRRLEGILGPVTVAMASGGEWADPNTGELVPKMHFHWRLAEPTREQEEHADLRQARWLAAVLVGGDRTAAPPAHPLRWPGSWNTKRSPRLAQITHLNEAAEIHLSEAVDRLQEALEAAGLATLGGLGIKVSGVAEAPLADIADALQHIPNADLHWDDWNRIGMAAWRATGGAEEGLEAWAAWSAKSSAKHDGDACAIRWAHYSISPPNKLGAGTIFFLARANGWKGRSAERNDPPPDPFGDGAEASALHHEPEVSQPAADATHSEGKTSLWLSSDDWQEETIPSRPWISPRYLLRGSVTVVAGPGSGGKSSLMVAWASSLALGVPHGRFEPKGALKVITYNVEDDDDEQKRRFSAALRQFDKLPHHLAGKVFRCGPHNVGTLMERDPVTGTLRFTQAWEELEHMAAEVRPDVVMLDPLVELHTAEENDNTAVRQVIAVLRAFAKRHNCAVVLIHHSRKGGQAGDPDMIRGGGAIVGAARVALTVMPMSEEEADELGILKSARKGYFRLDSAKANYAASADADWYELSGYELDNGDEVASALPWKAPTPKQRAGIDSELMRLIANDVRQGTPQGPYSSKLSPQEERSVSAVFMRRGLTDARAQKQALQELLALGFSSLQFRTQHRHIRTGLRSPDGLPAVPWVGEGEEASR